jgi:hypothetical protein
MCKQVTTRYLIGHSLDGHGIVYLKDLDKMIGPRVTITPFGGSLSWYALGTMGDLHDVYASITHMFDSVFDFLTLLFCVVLVCLEL